MKEKGTRLPESVHKAMIDEYYANGFVGYKAVQAIHPQIESQTASSYFSSICKLPQNVAYIEQKVAVLRSETQIKAIQVLRELITFSFSDVTDYMDLGVSDLKALPPEIRRCIASFKKKTTKYLPRGAKVGEEVTEENIEIKLIDKVKALEMINKHIGFYSEDNKQKSVKIDLSKASNVQLNMLLSLTEAV